jgi:hypothetical protein
MEDLIEIDGFWVSKNSNVEFVKFLSRARSFGYRIRVNLNPGWAESHRYSSKDLLSFTCVVGKSGGTKPIPLVLDRKNDMGGMPMTTCVEAIKSWQYAN